LSFLRVADEQASVSGRGISTQQFTGREAEATHLGGRERGREGGKVSVGRAEGEKENESHPAYSERWRGRREGGDVNTHLPVE